MEMPGTGTRKYDSKKALPAPNRKVARTTLAGSRRLSIEAIVQRTSIEGAMAAAPRVDGRAAKISLARRSIGWQPIKEELSRRTAYWQSFNGCCRWPEFIGCSCPNQCLLLAAASTDRRNTSVKSLCWGFKLQGLAWSLVELTRHFVEMSLRVHRQVGALRKVLPQ